MRNTAHMRTFRNTACSFVVALWAAQCLPAQTCDSACNQFISTTDAAITSLTSTAVGTAQPLILSGQLYYANGSVIDDMTQEFLIDYVDGLKAAGAQRIDINPGVTSINDATSTAIMDAVVQHIRELGLQLAINPEVDTADRTVLTSFQAFQTMAETAYPALAQRYQPDYFVIVHEPTTQDARLSVTATTGDWDTFVRTLAPLIKAAAPHAKLGTGGFYSNGENTIFEDLATIPTCSASSGNVCTDFMTMDIYSDAYFAQLAGWIQLAKQNGKGIYIEETWAPAYLPANLPPGWQSNPAGVEGLALIGPCDTVFEQMDSNWLQAVAKWAAVNGLMAITPFTTPAFFYYGSSSDDQPTSPAYVSAIEGAVQAGQTLTPSGQGYAQANQQYAIKQVTNVSSASYATLPSVFNPNCGSADNPCNAQTVVAPDELISAFGANLATTTLLDGSFPANLGGTTVTLVDSSNTSYPVPIFFVSSGQVNYYVPASVKAGPATVTVTSGDGTVTSGIVLVMPVMPGLYTASANGKGAPAAIAIVQRADGTRVSQFTFSCSGGTCSPAAIQTTSTDSLYLELYGTGIRHASSLSGVTATINGQNVPVSYAGVSGYTGEDQVNIQIPQSLFQSGTVNLVLTVDGQTSNTVTLDLE